MTLERGKVVFALSGREKSFFAVVGVEDGRVLIANGHHYTVEKPKRKNSKHLSTTDKIISEENLAYNGRLKKALSELSDKPQLDRRVEACQKKT